MLPYVQPSNIKNIYTATFTKKSCLGCNTMLLYATKLIEIIFPESICGGFSISKKTENTTIIF